MGTLLVGRPGRTGMLAPLAETLEVLREGRLKLS